MKDKWKWVKTQYIVVDAAHNKNPQHYWRRA
jgi:hypothetical protein